LHVRQSRRHALIGHHPIQLILGEQLYRVGPEGVQGRLNSRVTLRGTVAEAHQPAAAVAQVIEDFFHGFRRNRRQARIRGGRHALVEFQLEGIDQDLTHNGLPEVAVWLFGQDRVQVFAVLPQKGHVILAAAAAFDFAGIGQ